MRILVVRVGRTGDMVMCTPALSALLDLYPSASFTFLTSPDGKRVLGDFSARIKEFWIYDRKRFLPFLVRRALSRKILAGKFDHIYCFESNKSYRRLWEGTSASVHAAGDLGKHEHYAQFLLDVVRNSISHDIGHYPLHLPVDAAATADVDEYLKGLGVSKNTYLIAFHPTFSGASNIFKFFKHKRNKLWPMRYYGDLACRLIQYSQKNSMDVQIVINLMPDELKYGKMIELFSKGMVKILQPKPNFQRYIAFLKRVDLLVVPDTGPMHIAAAVGANLIALFSGKDPNNCGPFPMSEKFTVLRAEDQKIPAKGLAAIDVDTVYRKCLEHINPQVQ